MALSRPIGWLRDQRGDAVGLATADPLFQGGETKPTGYVATYSPVFTAEQVQQESKEASMALTPERINELKEQAVSAWRAAGFEPMLQVFVAHAIETEVRKQDEALIRQMLDALELPGTKPSNAAPVCCGSNRRPCAAGGNA